MHLDRATPADLAALHALIESAYRGETARAGWSNEADLLHGPRTAVADLRAMLADNVQRLLVFREGKEVVACVALTDLGQGRAYLGLLTVAPLRQASGFGRLLLAAAEHYAASELGTRLVEMTVIAQRPELIAWYERRGYLLSGERRPFPYSNPSAGALREDLEFVVLERSLA